MTPRRNLGFRLALGLGLAIVVVFVCAFLASNFLYAGPRRILGLLARGEALHSIGLSFWTSTIATALSMLFGVPVAYALARYQVRGLGVVDVLLDLPIVLPPLVAGFSLLLLYALVDRALGSGFRGGWLDLRFTVAGIVLAQLTIAAPLAVRVMRSTFADVPVRLETMSRSLGANEGETFRRVSLPLARNGILAGTLLVWARSVAEFGPILVFAGAVRGKTDVLPISIFLSFSNGEIENGVALSALLVVGAAVVLVGIRRLGGKLVLG